MLTSLATILVFINTRYKMMVVVPSIYLFVFGLWQMIERISVRKYWSVSLYFLIIIGLFALGMHCWIPVVKDRVAVKFNNAMDLLERGELNSAKVLLKEILSRNPRDYLSWFALGNIYYKQGRLNDAQKCYINSLRINPLYADALFNLGMVYLDKKKFKKAEYMFLQLYQISPFKADVVYNLMRAEVGLGKCGQAHVLGDRLLGINPEADEEVKRIIGACKTN